VTKRPDGNDSEPFLHVLNQDVLRGGVKVDTGRDSDEDLVLSRLSLARAKASDTGNYTCALSGPMPDKGPRDAWRGLTDTVAVHVIRAENTEAIHSGVEDRSLTRLRLPPLVFQGLSMWALIVRGPANA